MDGRRVRESCRVVLAGSFILAGCAEESTPLRVVPVEPAESRVASEEVQYGTVGAPTPDSLGVLVTDRFGNPVPRVAVRFEVDAGDGSVEPAVAETGLDGMAWAEWTLGTVAGENVVVATPEGTTPLTFVAYARPGEPKLESISGDAQADTVGAKLAQPLVVRVADKYGNVIEGRSVTWVVQAGGGTVSPDESVSDAEGYARVEWSLGPMAGVQMVAALVSETAAPVVFQASAAPGVPAEVAVAGGDGQSGPAGSGLAQPIEAVVRDAHGNPIEGVRVAWEVTLGGGVVDPDTSVTDAAGIARTRLTLGNTPGEQAVRARVDGLPDVTFRAFAGEPVNLSVPYAYLVQSVQRLDGSVPLVAGRDALLRVFVTADQASAVRPDVRVDFYVHGSRVATETLPAPSEPVSMTPREDLLDGSWNLLVPGERIVPGLSILVTVDPDGEVFESDKADNTFPASGTPLPVDVRELPPFRVVFVPIRSTSSGEVGDVTAANAHTYLADALKLLPVSSVEVSVRAPFTPSVAQVVTADDWMTVISEVRQLRRSESNTSYYYGVIPYAEGTPYCGLGYIGLPVAIGVDVCGASTAAHEWGHNLDRLHAPCGDPADPDPDYPYAGAAIGVFGYDIEAGRIRSPLNYRDLMSYCTPRWISDYNFREMLRYRQVRESSVAWDIGQPHGPALMLWGRIGDGSAILEPAYEIDTRAALPSRPGPYRLQGLDAAGDIVFELSFEGDALDHTNGVRHFSFAVPTSVAQPQRLARLRLTGPGLLVERVREPATAVAPAPDVEPAGRGLIRLRWDAAGAPLIVVRDPATRQILSFARGGAATIRSDSDDVELIVSDGVGNRSLRRVEVRR